MRKHLTKAEARILLILVDDPDTMKTATIDELYTAMDIIEESIPQMQKEMRTTKCKNRRQVLVRQIDDQELRLRELAFEQKAKVRLGVRREE